MPELVKGGYGSASAQTVYLSCDSSNNNQANPSNLTASVGDSIYWEYVAGHYPPNFEVTLDPGACSNGKTTIKSDRDFCVAAKSTTYHFTANGCNANPGTAQITVQ
jgi:hypothetical protein